MVVVAGCGGHSRDGKFVGCLTFEGGKIVTSPADLTGVSEADPDIGAGASLKSIEYASYSVAAGPGLRQQVVLVGRSPFAPAAEMWHALKQTGKAPSGDATVVLMPPARDYDRTLTACEHRVAPGESFP
jgi:hypothetical protein